MSTFRKVDNLGSDTMANVNSPFAVVIEEKILQILTFPECVVLSPSLYMLILVFSSISVNSAFQNVLQLFTSISEHSLCEVLGVQG